MKSHIRFVNLVLAATLLGGCAAGVDRAVFVTKTSLSVLDVDSTPPSVNVAYNRTEGFIGPSYEEGGAPPAIAVIKSDGSVLNPEVKQLYATGNAALAASGDDNVTAAPLVGQKKLMTFGTDTTVGLKVGIDPTVNGNFIPNNFLFGYRRKEFSLLPLGERDVPDGDGNPIKQGIYPTVLASIDTTGATDSRDIGLKNAQYFATGQAAINVAKSKPIQDAFLLEAEDAFGSYHDNLTAQRLTAGEILNCYAKVRMQDRLAVVEDAHKLDLIPTEGNIGFDALAAILKDSNVLDLSDPDAPVVRDADRLARVNWAYGKHLYVADGMDAARHKLMKVHEKTVCDLAALNK